MSAETLVLLVVAILLAVAVTLAVALIFVRRLARSGRQQIRTSLRGELAELEGNARLIGVESRGRGQMRGTGTLALTARELVFVMWAPRQELRIPREAIESVETGHGVAGKRVAGKQLHVRWRTAGGVDEAAWGVKDLAAWMAAMRPTDQR